MRKFGGSGLFKSRSPWTVVLVVLALGGMIGAAGWRRLHSRLTEPPRSSTSTADTMHLPRVMLWAWERPEDLRFIDPHTTGVAFLAGTVEIRALNAGTAGSEAGVASMEATVVLHPRLQPLSVPPGTALMAVVRVKTPNDLWHRPSLQRASESPASAGPAYTNAQRLRVAEMIASVAGIPDVRAVQVDYDATQSERTFYRQLLEDVRRRLPHGVPLSMTALASWCIGDTWLDSLPEGTIDEAVPMLFRMGPDAANVAAFVQGGNAFRARGCRASLGVSTDEDFSQSLLKGQFNSFAGRRDPRRIYIFSNHAWTKKGVQQLVREIRTWDAESPQSP
jgi:hypothetical protein